MYLVAAAVAPTPTPMPLSLPLSRLSAPAPRNGANYTPGLLYEGFVVRWGAGHRYGFLRATRALHEVPAGATAVAVPVAAGANHASTTTTGTTAAAVAPLSVVPLSSLALPYDIHPRPSLPCHTPTTATPPSSATPSPTMMMMMPATAAAAAPERYFLPMDLPPAFGELYCPRGCLMVPTRGHGHSVNILSGNGGNGNHNISTSTSTTTNSSSSGGGGGPAVASLVPYEGALPTCTAAFMRVFGPGAYVRFRCLMRNGRHEAAEVVLLAPLAH